MKKIFLICLLLCIFAGTSVAISYAASRPTPTKTVSQTKKQPVKQPIKKAVKPPVKKQVKKPVKKPVKKAVLGKSISAFIACVGPDGKTAYAPKKDCDNLWNFWNSHKPSTPSNNTGESNSNNNNNSSNNNSNNSSNDSNSNVSTPTATPTTEPTSTPIATSIPTPTETPTATLTPSPVPTHRITGNVYVDTNGNGVKDQGEINVSNITVYINTLLNTNTDASGSYNFSNLEERTYRLDISDPDNSYLSSWKVVALTEDIVVNFGLTLIEKPAVVIDPSVHKISGRVFIDTNNNGIQEQNEANASTVGVKLSGAKEGQEYTAPFNGYYSFPDLTPGTYTLTMMPLYDHIETTSNPVTIELTKDIVINFGIKRIPAYTLSGNVYIDINNNGVKDYNEDSFKDALIDLYVPTWKQGRTDNIGNYDITDIKAGTYELSMQIPAGYYLPTSNPTEIVITDNTTVNFGLVPLPTSTPTPYLSPMPTPTSDPRPRHSISGTVFIDANGNGVKDQYDQNLRNYYIHVNEDITRTNDYGQYYIAEPEDAYTVSVELPAGYIATTSNNVTIALTQDTTVNFGVTIDSSVTPTSIPYGYMQIHNAYVLPCTSSSCSGITTVVVEGVHFPDDAYVYLYRLDPRVPGIPPAYSPVVGGATIVNKVNNTKITTDFVNVDCANYYLNVYSPKYMMSGNQHNIDLKPYICN